MKRTPSGIQVAALAMLAPLWFACSAASVDEILIPRNARQVQKHSFPESKSSQIYYNVDIKYPKVALTDAHFEELRRRGWEKCSDEREGWESYVDASHGEGKEQTIFQNVSYWHKDQTLLTIVMKYEAGVTEDKRALEVPNNTTQHIIVIKDRNPGTKDWLGINC